jgi:hypothetical protein
MLFSIPFFLPSVININGWVRRVNHIIALKIFCCRIDNPSAYFFNLRTFRSRPVIGHEKFNEIGLKLMKYRKKGKETVEMKDALKLPSPVLETGDGKICYDAYMVK